MLWYQLATSHVHLQIQVDKKRTDCLWKTKDDLQANAEHFSHLDLSQANKIKKSKAQIQSVTGELLGTLSGAWNCYAE